MPKLTIQGIPPWDGDYQFDDFSFTNGELYEIKKLSGIRAAELLEALSANDTAAYVGVGKVVLNRHGKNVDEDDLWNAKVGSVTIWLDDVEDEDDADPPPTAPAESSSGGNSGGGSDSVPGGD